MPLPLYLPKSFIKCRGPILATCFYGWCFVWTFYMLSFYARDRCWAWSQDELIGPATGVIIN